MFPVAGETVTTQPEPTGRVDLLTRERLETLLGLSQEFNATLDLDVLLPRILELTLSVTESEAASLWVVEHDRCRCVHASGPTADRLVGQETALGEGVVGEVLERGSTLLTPNALDDDRYLAYRDEVAGFRTRSAVTVPLIAAGTPLGALQLVNDVGGKDEFDDADVAFLESLADDAAAVLRNARLLESERRARNLKALLEISQEITATFDLDRVLMSVVNLAGRAVAFDRCVLAAWSGEDMHVRAISGETKVDPKSTSVQHLERLLLWSAESDEPLVLRDVRTPDDARAATICRLFDDYLEDSQARGLVLLPIADAEGELGRLLLEFRAPDALDDWTTEAGGLLANVAALAMRNAQLYGDVPFISILEPLAQTRRALARLPQRTLLRYGAVAVVALALLTLVRFPLRVTASEAEVYAGIQRPARAGAGGIIEEFLVREGDQVEAGQVIARLRNEALQARVTQAEADLRIAERQALAAEASGDAAGAAAQRLSADQLRAALALLRREAATLEVRAPAAGVVLTPRLEERLGSYREAGEPVAWIGSADSAEVRLKVAEQDVALVQPHQQVRLRVSARPDLRLDGVVRAVAPLAEDVDGRPQFTVLTTFANPGGILRPGMVARARVLTQPRSIGQMILRRPWRFIRMHLWW